MDSSRRGSFEKTILDLKRKSEMKKTSDVKTDINKLVHYNNLLGKSDVIGFERRIYWKGCCGDKIDSRMIQYMVKVAMGLIGIFFCMAQIFTSEPHECTGEDTTVYISTLFTIIGIFVPSPVLK